jgi:hypothetical protein
MRAVQVKKPAKALIPHQKAIQLICARPPEAFRKMEK